MTSTSGIGRLSDIQLRALFESNARINILDGSVRSGKTHVSLLRWVDYIQNSPPGDLLMLGNTYGTLTRNIINPLENFIGSDFRFIPSRNLARVWGRDIYCYGAGSKDAVGKIQGMTAAGCYGDEVTLWPEEVFKMMLSRLSIDNSKFIGTTNPDAPRHYLKKDFIDRIDALDLMRFHFKLEDNIALGQAYIDSLKSEYTGLWYKRYIDGLWCIAEGAIYDFFEELPPYIIKLHPRPKYHVLGIDYGTQNPFAALLFGVNPDTTPKIWLEKEYVYSGREQNKQKTDSEYSEDVREFLGDIKPRRIYPDPSAKSFIIQLKRDKFRGVQDNADNSVLDGIRTQSRMLKNGEYAICEGNTRTIEEYSGYVWDDKAQARGEDKPIKESDHTKDAERYVLHSMFGQSRLDYSVLNRM